MTVDPSVDFDVDELHEAVDAKRRSLGMSWQQAARAISTPFRGAPFRPISPSTLTGMRDRRVLEGDGVLQILRWLGSPPERFTPGHGPDVALPDLPPDRILRFDTQLIYTAVNARRIERGMTWKEVAAELPGTSAAGLTHLARGGRVGFPNVVRIAKWLGRPVASLTRVSER